MFRKPFLVHRWIAAAPLMALSIACALAAAQKPVASKPGEPTDAKAQKTFATAAEWEKQRNYVAAMENFRKADKQDGGQCWVCLRRAFELAIKIGDFKNSVEIAREWLPMAQSDQEKAMLHFQLAMALQRQGINEKKDKCFAESCEEFKTALELNPRFATSHYALGVSLARLHQDDAARAQFSAFLSEDKDSPMYHERAERYVERVDLARATMAPPFSITTIDGQHVSLDSLQGKVVLIDFWATWCGPCREALPHIKEIAHKFEGQPLVVISISLDRDEAKWKEFVGKNGMTWLQYRDGGFDGQIAKRFNVNAIPATFTIDAEGVLEDQHVGDANIDGKLKKLVARAVEVANRKPLPAESAPGPGQ